jgi:hypothetical protein
MMERASSPARAVIADGLPLQRLYARFDAIAAGLAKGDSLAAHQSVIARLAANQLHAESLGWTGFVLERVGGSGRLELRGIPAGGLDRELVPDAIPHGAPTHLDTESARKSRRGREVSGQIGGGVARMSWRARLRWMDDGGR